MSDDLLGCPFCGHQPDYDPKEPEREGDAWSKLSCQNAECPVTVEVTHYDDEMAVHKAAVVVAWNARA